MERQSTAESPSLRKDRNEPKHQHKAAWGAMLAGAALSIYGWTRKSASGAALGVAGGAIALKAASAGPIADLIGTETTASRSVIIMRAAAELYAFWKDVEKAPLWMEQVQSVTRIDERNTRWLRQHPGAGTLEWRTEITEDVRHRSLSWRTLPGSDSNYDLSGRVEFDEFGHNRGTQVTLTIRYKMRGGLLHSSPAMIIGHDAEQQMRENLRRFKMLMEAGEIATIRGQSHGLRRSKGKVLEAIVREEQSATTAA